MGMLPETFTMACSTFVTLLTTPSSCGIPLLEASIQEVSRNVILSSFCAPQGNPNQVLLYSLYLLGLDGPLMKQMRRKLSWEYSKLFIQYCYMDLMSMQRSLLTYWLPRLGSACPLDA
eukprot:TRINITY_DN41464_c0_g1_i1.p1 TRINITY_DN41464_c0_g1~~TRINITY_DN41464_c0_g1_i1.p1  ORF type:complete len:118 (+),score=19.94 TRINITY_DN41464_c0_g1_i1:407-760(+)